MNIDSVFELIISVVYAMNTHLEELDPKTNTLLYYFVFVKENPPSNSNPEFFSPEVKNSC